MKKYFAIFILFCIVVGLFYICSGDDIHKQERYFSKINSIIKAAFCGYAKMLLFLSYWLNRVFR